MSTSYLVEVKKSLVKSVCGGTLSQDFSFSFTTAELKVFFFPPKNLY